jgi:hypothetical protein
LTNWFALKGKLTRNVLLSEPSRRLITGRRDKGYVFGAFRPATGDALRKTYGARSAVNWADFLFPDGA